MAVFHEQGTYKADITKAEITKAKSGTQQLELELNLTMRVLQNNEGEPDFPTGRFPPRVYLSLTEATLGTAATPGWVTETLRFLGFNGDFDDMAQFEGMQVEVFCQHTKGLSGDDREQWNINRPKDRAVAHLEKKEVRSLNTKFGKLFKTGKDAGGKDKPTKEEPAPAPSVNGEAAAPPDNIPF